LISLLRTCVAGLRVLLELIAELKKKQWLTH